MSSNKMSSNYRKYSSSNAQNSLPNIKSPSTRGIWSEEENELLLNWVSLNGECQWNKCSQIIKGRNAKQCREHWYEFLNPNLTKGNWTLEEDLLIMIFYQKYNGRWKNIIPIFEKRSENSIKNRFYSELRKISSKYENNLYKEPKKKLKLNIILKYLEQGIENAKKKYLEKSNISEDKLNEYIDKIDESVKNLKKKDKYIDLNSIKEKKGIDIIILDEDKEEKKSKKKNQNIKVNNSKRKKLKKIKNNEDNISVEIEKSLEILIDNESDDKDIKNEYTKLKREKPFNQEILIKSENKNSNSNNIIGLNQLNINNETANNANDNNDNQKFIHNKKYDTFKAKPYDIKRDFKRKDTFDELDEKEEKDEKNYSNVNNNKLVNIYQIGGSFGIQKNIYKGEDIMPFPSFDNSGNVKNYYYMAINASNSNNSNNSNQHAFKLMKTEEKGQKNSNFSNDYNNFILKNLNPNIEPKSITSVKLISFK